MWNDNQDSQYYAPPPPVIHHTTSPLIEGVIIPGLQCLITGLLSGLAALAVAAWLGGPIWAVGGTTAAIVGLYSWLSYRGGWNDRLERMLGIDLNLNGVIGPAPQPAEPERVRVEVIQDQGSKGDFIDLPYPSKLPELAAGIVNGKQFALSVWTGNGHLFSRSEFEEVRDEMLERGLLRWRNERNPAQGVDVTAVGRAVLKRLAKQSPTPPQE